MAGGRLLLRAIVGLYAAAILYDLTAELRGGTSPLLAIYLPFRRLGAVAITAGLAALIARLIRLRRWQGVAFLAISLTLIICLVRAQAPRLAAVKAWKLFETAREQAREGRLRPGSLRAKGTGDVVIFANYLIGKLEDGDAIAGKYSKAYETVDIAAIIAPGSYASAAKAAQARAELEHLSRLATAHRQEMRQWLGAADAEMEALPLSPRFRERVVRGYSDSARRTGESFERFSTTVDEFLAACTELQALMQRERGHYVVLGNDVRFDHQEAADEYNRLSKRVTVLAGEQRRALEGILKPAEGSI